MTPQGYSPDLYRRHVRGARATHLLASGGLSMYFFFFLHGATPNNITGLLRINGTFSPHLISDSMHFSLKSHWCVVSDCALSQL